MTELNTTPVHADALSLSDADLDAVSGGVNPGIVLASIFTLGIACAAVSLVEAAAHKDCGDTLSR